MNIKWILVVLLLLLGWSSCGIFYANYYWTEEGGRRPISARFQLAKPSPYMLQVNDPVDTAAIYIRYDKLEYGGKMYDQYMALRFFSNGRFFIKLINSMDSLNAKLFNHIAAVRNPGYYRIENGNEIRIEDFGLLKDPYDILTATYSYSRGYFKNDTLYMFAGLERDEDFPVIKYKNGHSTNAGVYIPYKLKGLKGQANW